MIRNHTKKLEVNSIDETVRNKKNRRFCCSFVAIYTFLISSCSLAFADIFGNVKSTMATLFSSLLGISTFVAALLALVCLITMMCSKSSNAVQNASDWLKRIIICYILINLLGYGIQIVQELTAGGGVDWDSLK